MVQKRMGKMKVADGCEENKGTIENYLSNVCERHGYEWSKFGLY